MKKSFAKILIMLVTIVLTISMAVFPAFAANDNNGNNNKEKKSAKTSVHIHKADSVGNNQDEITIQYEVTDENGNKKTVEKSGKIKGSVLTIDLETEDNYFDLSNGNIKVSYKNKTSGDEGSFEITGKEGNDTSKPNKKQEQDEGLNNFDASNITKNNKDDSISDVEQTDPVQNENKDELIQNNTQQSPSQSENKDELIQNNTQHSPSQSENKDELIQNNTQQKPVQNVNKDELIQNNTQQSPSQSENKDELIQNNTQQKPVQNENKDELIQNNIQQSPSQNENKDVLIQNNTEENLSSDENKDSLTSNIIHFNPTQENIPIFIQSAVSNNSNIVKPLVSDKISDHNVSNNVIKPINRVDSTEPTIKSDQLTNVTLPSSKLIKPELNIKAVKKESVQKTTETNEVIRIRSEVLFNIEDEDVPLASVPKTGDNTITLAAVIFSALLAVILINVKGKRTEK